MLRKPMELNSTPANPSACSRTASVTSNSWRAAAAATRAARLTLAPM